MTSYPQPCCDCWLDTKPGLGRGYDNRRWEVFMVTAAVWQQAGLQNTRQGVFICIGCLEARLGRTLRRDDFTDCPLNEDRDMLRTERLRQRLNIADVENQREGRAC